MRVDEIVKVFLDEGVQNKIIIDTSRSEISLYNSLRKYIIKHNLRLSVHLKGGKIELSRDDAIRKDKTVCNQ